MSPMEFYRKVDMFTAGTVRYRVYTWGHVECVLWQRERREKEEETDLGSDTEQHFQGRLLTFQTEEEASQDIKEKMSNNCPPTHGQDVHVTRDVVIESLRQSS